MRRRFIPGEYGDSFDQRIREGRCHPGEIGQYVEHNVRFSMVASYQEIVELISIRCGGILPAFGWKAGDGNSPSHWLGAANTADRLAVTGVPVPGTTPYVDRDGPVASEVYDGGERRQAIGVRVGPVAEEDMVCIVATRMPLSPAPSTSYYIINTDGPTGPRWSFLLRTSATGEIGYRFTADDGATLEFAKIRYPAAATYIIGVAIYDADGQLHIVTQQGVDTTAIPPGVISSTDGIALGAGIGGGAEFYGEILLSTVFVGAGIADAFTADTYDLSYNIMSRLTGVSPRQGDTPTFSRDSAASWLSGRDGDAGRLWAIASAGMPRAGDSGGLRSIGVARTNELYANINNQDATGWGVTGGGATSATLATVDDATELETCHEPSGDEVDASAWGPNVLKLDNSAGDAAAYAYGTPTTGDTDARSTQVIARQTGPGGAELGWRDSSSGAFTSLASLRAGGEYGHTLSEDDTPPDTDAQTAFHAPAGAVVYFVAGDRKTGPVCSSPVPNWQTAAAAVCAAEVLGTGVTLSDAQGSVEADITPLGWSGTEPDADVRILTRETTDGDLLIADGATAGYLTGDGTNEAQATTTTPADQVERKVRVRWAGDQMSIDVDGDRDSADYDGALDGAGDLEVSPTAAEVGIRNLRVYRNGDG